MKIKNVNSKRLALLIMTGFVLMTTSCKKQETNPEIEQIETEDNTEELENTEFQIIEGKIEEKESENIESTETIGSLEIIPENSEVSTEKVESTEQNADQVIDTYLEDLNSKIKKSSENGNLKEIKEIITSNFIKIVDFIWYGSTINGITYDELSDATKQNMLETFQLLDHIIDQYFPDYKQTISSKYSEIKEKTEEKVHDKIGNDNWNKLGDAKDSLQESLEDVGDVLGNLTESGKVKVKNWYEQLKENQK